MAGGHVGPETGPLPQGGWANLQCLNALRDGWWVWGRWRSRPRDEDEDEDPAELRATMPRSATQRRRNDRQRSPREGVSGGVYPMCASDTDTFPTA